MVKRLLGALTILVFAAWLSIALGPVAFASSTPSQRTSSHSYSAQNGSYTEPQPYSNADLNGTGANPGSPSSPNPYMSTRDGSASNNGNGTGNGSLTGKPCAGCVGKADNKNPLGQQPGPQDVNNGYECDGNHGIALGNPAHTACTQGSSGGGGSGPGTPGCVPNTSNNNCGNGSQSSCIPDVSNNNCGNGSQSSCIPDVSNNNCGSTPPGAQSGSGGLTSGTPALTSLQRSTAPLTGEVPLAGAAPAAPRTAGTGLAFTGPDSAGLALVGLLLLSGGLLIAGAARGRRHSTKA